jgi:hypothetical protein
MELFRRSKPEESFDEFWKRTGDKRGGTVGTFTFSTFVGSSGGEVMGLPGLMYTVGDSLWFEDFERDNWLARLFGGKKSFQQTEVGFSRSDVSYTRVVSRSTAYRCIRGSLPVESAKPLSPALRLFTTSVTQIGLASGTCHFFEIMKQAEIVSFLKK